jgi:hypothetical protein
MELFGFSITKSKQDQNLTSFAPVETDDGALVVTAGGSYGTYLDMEGAAKTEAELVVKYREMALQPECEKAIDEVTNEAIVKEGSDEIVTINLDDIRTLSPKVKQIITDEFSIITSLLNFNNYGYEIFRRWYVDGRLYYHILINENDPEQGIQELRYVDPRKIRKVRLIDREKKGLVYVNKNTSEFYVYNEKGFKQTSSTGMDNQGLKISTDSILHSTSGLMDKDGKLVLSYLHKAIKPLNQLRSLEDANVIYCLSRASERRVFYVDIGNLPKQKAEQHMRDMMVKHKNRLIYDASTGGVRDDRKFMTLTEDYWFPRRDGQDGTTVTTLPAGQSLGKMENVEYFEKKLYGSLNVPISRIRSDVDMFNIGRSSEITRDELSFQKFIVRLRLRFSKILLDALEKQLILKKIFTKEDWDQIKDKVHFNFARDNYFAELKDAEILRDRLTTLQMIQPFLNQFYSEAWTKKHVLMMTDNDIKEIKEQIEQEEQDNFEKQKEQMIRNAQLGLDINGEQMELPEPAPAPEVTQQKPNKEQTKKEESPSSDTSTASGEYTLQTVQTKYGTYKRKMPVHHKSN